MSKRNSFFLLLVVVAFLIATGIPTNSQVPERNVNMVEGQTLPGGDPWLQRQNEPSLAVSTRNPLHLLAGANDYRTVEIPIPGEELPGLPEGTAAGDAWLGVFKSFDGGESWMSTLLPGYPQDGTLEGTNSLLYGFQAAADPTVRAGTNGLFYYSGIAFNRVEHGRSVVFIARYIDNNNIEDPNPENDPIKYIDTKIIDEGTSGQFADKPWIAADIPRNGETVQVNGQSIPSHNIYIVYSLFLGDLAEDVHNKILFARSTDCGNNWEHPIKLSESQHINQGTTLAVDPSNGTIYVAWRRFASEGESNAIMFCKSIDGGKKFSKATAVAEINPFDQGTTVTSFRTNAFPTIAVDRSNNVYLAWSERDASLHGNAGEDARIVIITGKNGKNWSSQELVDDYDGHGHQIMPSLTFAAGKLMMAWYDFRKDVAGNECTHWADYISDDHDFLSCNFRHTVDVRIAEASLEMNPGFGGSVQVSRYYWIMKDDGTCFQAQFNPPNYPLFKQGTVPFMGDYIDICPSPMFVLENGDWRFNTEPEDPSIFHVTWTDNRDVRPPPYGNWTIYNPPTSSQPGFPTPGPCSEPDRTGMRNQNIYTSRIIPGIEVSSLGNTKSLDIQRAFAICVKNTTDYPRYFQLTIPDQPPGGQASFLQSGDVVGLLPVTIAPHSSISRPVFVQSSDPYESVRIEVKETDKDGVIIDDGLQSFIVLNPDPTNPVVDPVDETHDPIIESLLEVNLVNANLVNANLVNQNIPDVNLVNANLVNANLVNVNLVNANLVNANLVNPSIYDSVNLVNVNLVNASVTAPDAVTDVQWKVTNNGNTTSSYTFKSVAPESLPEGLYAQLIIYRAHTTPGTDGENCELMEVPHHEVLVNLINTHIIDPNVEDVNLINPDLENAAIENATFALAPGEEAIVALRIIKNPGSGLSTAEAIRTAEEFTEDVGVGVTSHSLNTGETEYRVSTTEVQIFTLSLPNGAVGTDYTGYVKIFGGTPLYIPSIISGALPHGLGITYPSGDDYTIEISRTPLYKQGKTYPYTYTFTLKVADASGDFDTQDLSILILDKLEILTGTSPEYPPLPDGILGDYYNQTLIAKGGIGDYTWSISSGSLPDDLSLDQSTSVISGNAIESGTFDFTVKVTDPGLPEQEATETLSITFLALIPTIEGTVNFGGGGLPGVTIEAQKTSGGSITATTDGNGWYSIEVDYGWTGTVTPSFGDYLFYPPSRTYDNPVIADQTGQDYTAYIEEWMKMYNNDSVNGDDEASAIAIDSSFVYVTGYSTGKTTGEDYATVKYHSSGNMEWDVKYDGPSHEGDFANAIAVDSSGSVYVTGYSYRGIPHKHADYYTVKYDSSRNVIWDVRYDSRRNGNDVARAMVLDLSGNLWVTGKSEESLGSGDKDHDYYTVKYAANNGKRLWHDRFDGPGDEDDEAAAIAVDSSGVYVTGKIAGNGTSFDYYTVKYDVNIKKRLWEATYDGPGDDEATAIAVDESGNVYVTGRSFKGSGTGFDYTTIKYNKDGIQQWVTSYSGPGNGDDEAVAIAVDSSGVYVTGKITGNGTGFDYCTVKYDSSGNKLWNETYNGPDNGNDEAAALAIDSTGVYVTGKSQGNGTYYDYATLKYDFSGNVVLIARYEGPGDDVATDIAIESRNIYVTGSSQGSTTAKDYATIKYKH